MNRMQVGGEDQEIQARVSGIGTTVITSYAWVSSTPGVATVTPIGDGYKATLHAVAAGTTTITLTAAPLAATTVDVTVTATDAGRASIAFSSPLGQTAPNDPGSGGGQQPSPNPQ